MIIKLTKEVSEEMFGYLIEALNTLPENDLLTIYLCSEGGSTMYSEVIADLINKNHNRIELIAYGDIQSAAFEIFFLSYCPRYIMVGAGGMYHQAKIPATLNNFGKMTDEGDRYLMQWMKGHRREAGLALMESVGATPKEMRKYKAGKDLYFTYERIVEMLDYQNKNITIETDLEDVQSMSEQHPVEVGSEIPEVTQ